MADRVPLPAWSRGAIAGLRISRTSFAWTLSVGTASVTIGFVGDSLALVAFGFLGLFDAAGSGALVVHFRHALRHDAVSERHETFALWVVTAGMAVLGLATMVEAGHRLVAHAPSERVPLGIALTAISAAVLAQLATRKSKIAPRIPSHALYADSWLSALGAALAVLTLTGIGLEAALGWWWLDPVAALTVAGGALAMSVALRRGPICDPLADRAKRTSRVRRSSEGSLVARKEIPRRRPVALRDGSKWTGRDVPHPAWPKAPSRSNWSRHLRSCHQWRLILRSSTRMPPW